MQCLRNKCEGQVIVTLQLILIVETDGIPEQSHCDCGEDGACSLFFWVVSVVSFKSICEQCDCHAGARRCSDVYGVICSMLIN